MTRFKSNSWLAPDQAVVTHAKDETSNHEGIAHSAAQRAEDYANQAADAAA